MGFSTERIARAAARRPWLTVGAWMVAVILAVGAVATLLELTTEGEVTSNPESERGYTAIGRHFPPDPSEEWVSELIVVRSARRTVDDSAFRRKVDAVLADVQLSGVVHNATSAGSSSAV